MEIGTCANFAHVSNDSKQTYQTRFYNLDAILSVGCMLMCFASLTGTTKQPLPTSRAYGTHTHLLSLIT